MADCLAVEQEDAVLHRTPIKILIFSVRKLHDLLQAVLPILLFAGGFQQI